MGNSESPISKIQEIIEQVKKVIPSERLFEFGVKLEILERVESYVLSIHILMDELKEFYKLRSLEEINRYSYAATTLRSLQEFLREVRAKEGGSKEYTSRLRKLINELDSAFVVLSTQNPQFLELESSTQGTTETSPIESKSPEYTTHALDIFPRTNQFVFISYAWGSEREEIVDQIDQALQQRGIKIIRDKRDHGYKGSIKQFMEWIGRGNCVIVVISDKYLRSSNCMFELIEIADHKQIHDRIFPIVLADANIYDPIRRIEYVKFWEEKRNELAQAMGTVDPANLKGIRDDMDLYDRIRDEVSELTSILKDMNAFTPETHRDSNFVHIYNAIEKRLNLLPY